MNEIDSPAQLILDSAENLSADLVVVGVRGRSRLSEVVLGSVSHRVLLHGSCPILIVRGAARKFNGCSSRSRTGTMPTESRSG